MFLGSESWIDTTKIESLDKQMKFNIAEIRTRKMRKGILKKINYQINQFFTRYIEQINNKFFRNTFKFY